ncbi:META domain-containing protein [Sedimentimonas flavescens]|uniref:META domain-containing protein n=1 Tax=Sedimentimonas flavescens TaxID=2851012 RepID=A0ABT3A2E1_9RHOB|nr:META domain-containing protein [Sedimentimonas flavescens]MBW0159231.1 META domain-containing protein [Sedimentimonas flavescens]MCV2880181.1 META domain-containing protein [Sedimentimonas flavescens]
MRLAMIALAALSLTACREESKADALAALPVGTEWQVREIAGQPVAAEVSVTLARSDESTITGNSGCNRYNGRIETREGKLHIGALAGTRMMCPPAQMEAEQAFHSTIGRVDQARLNGATLELLTGETVVIRAEK